MFVNKPALRPCLHDSVQLQVGGHVRVAGRELHDGGRLFELQSAWKSLFLGV